MQVGFIAAFLTSCAFIPQALKSIKTKDTKSISLPMSIMFNLGVGLWIIHGYLRKDYIVVGANIITLIPNVIILFLKLTEKNRL